MRAMIEAVKKVTLIRLRRGRISVQLNHFQAQIEIELELISDLIISMQQETEKTCFRRLDSTRLISRFLLESSISKWLKYPWFGNMTLDYKHHQFSITSLGVALLGSTCFVSMTCGRAFSASSTMWDRPNVTKPNPRDLFSKCTNVKQLAKRIK